MDQHSWLLPYNESEIWLYQRHPFQITQDCEYTWKQSKNSQMNIINNVVKVERRLKVNILVINIVVLFAVEIGSIEQHYFHNLSG